MSKNNITITDNCVLGIYKKNKSDNLLNLSLIADKHLTQLSEEYEGLLVYPNSFGDNGDGLNDKDKCICSFNNNLLKTNNIMGYISVKSDNAKEATHLRIGSRFDAYYEQNAESKKWEFKKLSGKDYFMLYLLSRVGKFNIVNFDYSEGPEGVFEDLKLLLFPAALKNALSQGLFKEYRSFDHNDANIKGIIDVNKHLRYNTPFNGKIAYHSREFSYDNPVTELIRHTIEYINTSKKANNMFQGDSEYEECKQIIYNATFSYNPNEREQVILQNRRPKVHPFYSEYTYLQQLCLEILREEKMTYGNSEKQVHGILFDGAWLWETYLATVLEPIGFIHPDNIAKKNAFKMFKSPDEEDKLPFNQDMYPDFYNDKCILDAKYKHLEKRVKREDLYQVISYMHTIPRDFGGYVYPYQPYQEDENIPDLTPMELSGMGGKIAAIPFILPKIDKYKWKDYCKMMNTAEDDFKKRIKIYFETK